MRFLKRNEVPENTSTQSVEPLRTQNQGKLSITIYGYHDQEKEILLWFDFFPFEYVLFYNENDNTEELETLLSVNIDGDFFINQYSNFGIILIPNFQPIIRIRQGIAIESDYLPGLLAHEYGHYLTETNITEAMREEVNLEEITDIDKVESAVERIIGEYYANKYAFENYPEYILNKSKYYFGTSEIQSMWGTDYEDELFWELMAFNQYFQLECVVGEPLETIFEDNTLPNSFWTHISELRKLELKCTKEILYLQYD